MGFFKFHMGILTDEFCKKKNPLFYTWSELSYIDGHSSLLLTYYMYMYIVSKASNVHFHSEMSSQYNYRMLTLFSLLPYHFPGS